MGPARAGRAFRGRGQAQAPARGARSAPRLIIARVGAPDLHFHDLRHIGNTLAALTRPSLRDLTARMGHDSVRAALVYQHKTLEADRAIAAAMSARIEVSREADSGADGSGGPGDSDG